MKRLARRSFLAAGAAAGLSGEVERDLDFSCLIPRRLSRGWVYREEGFHLWDPAMVRTPDGVCHLLYSRWPAHLGYDAWATHAQIAWATADRPEGPYRFRGIVLPARGAGFWDGHSVYNCCLLAANGRFYLYYTGNRGPLDWTPDRAPSMAEESWWSHRNRQRIGVATAAHPGGPWTRSDHPLLDTGPSTGYGITAVPNVIARRSGGYLLYYKTLAAGDGRFGGGVYHYASASSRPEGPFLRLSAPMVDKQRLLGTSTHFNFHIDDHVEWFQDGLYRAIVKDHDAPFLTPHGRALLLMQSSDGLTWRFSPNVLVHGFQATWEDSTTDRFERLEMPKLHLAGGVPNALFLAARLADSPAAASFLLTIPLTGSCPQ